MLGLAIKECLLSRTRVRFPAPIFGGLQPQYAFLASMSTHTHEHKHTHTHK